MFKIKTYNAISSKGLDCFPRDTYETASEIGHPDAYILRSHKLHGEDLPETVKAVARAGAGVNNIPIQEYTHKGVVVFNTPGANANAVKELVLAALLLGSRDIIGGMTLVQSLTDISDSGELSRRVEKEKKRFAGNELYGRTLGVVGLGAIGSMVADVAIAMGMKVLGFDPALSVDAAWRLHSQIERMENLQSLLAHSDFVTLHVPALPATEHLINADTLQSAKTGLTLINFARDAIVDAEAVVAALDSGLLKKYICDFPEPCLLNRPDVIAMPHIGASTEEAEENCAVMAAQQLVDFLENGNIRNSVNFPRVHMSRAGADSCRITFCNDNVAGVLGHVLSVLADYEVNVLDMVNKSLDDVAYNIIDVEHPPEDEIITAIGEVEHVVCVRVLD
jgi:D-3-phosphoglycerate dehydrogenase